jgi:hypothetical protein
MIETRTISQPHRQRRPNKVSVGTSHVSNHRKRQREAQREREEYTHAGGITHCSRCPPKRYQSDTIKFCEDCARINAARHKAGLIRPNCGPDHANNIIDPTVRDNHYRGQSRMLMYKRPGNKTQPVITAHIRQLGGGWRQGLASLNGRVVWEGPKTQSMDEAWAFAHERKGWIREGLSYEGKM